MLSMVKVPARLLLIPLLTSSAVLGCGTLPGGATAMGSRTFNVTGFSLPVSMTYSMAPSAAAQAVGISTSVDAAKAFVMRTIMQAVFDVLEQQGRAAGLPDFIIAAILNQLDVTINYTPLECKDVEVNKANLDQRIRLNMMMPKCIIFDSTVTAICNVDNMCILSTGEKLAQIPSEHLSILGTLTAAKVETDYDDNCTYDTRALAQGSAIKDLFILARRTSHAHEYLRNGLNGEKLAPNSDSERAPSGRVMPLDTVSLCKVACGSHELQNQLRKKARAEETERNEQQVEVVPIPPFPQPFSRQQDSNE
ncbi:hypothetical protein KIN20_030931 [Parelaphostrongylus tenuis]|uniref:Uncharacterized protein n=1 Tax=Parelaphostrongylus tenuis TaxID=148309 RepID=A0AAD5R4F4_PARTN|nr:hypothetical protein KIN20_030931 [Parelaphostrongylus tenuis]